VAGSLSLPRVLALVGGLGLVAAFYMPWFGSQGLLLSGQFLYTFLASASRADLQRFLPSSSPTEVQMLRVLVALFPVCGLLAAASALLGGIVRGHGRTAFNIVLALGGVVPLVAWGGGITRLPAGSTPEVGLYLIALGSIAVLVGLGLEVLLVRPTA